MSAQERRWDGSSKSASSTNLWSAHGGGNSNDYANAMGTDAAGNAYVCGYYYQTVNFGGHSLSSSGNSQDVFVGKLGPTGIWEWIKGVGSTSSDRCEDIAVDAGGNVTITGTFYSTVSFGSHSLSSTGSYDLFVARLDSAGNWLWATKAGGSSNDYGRAVAVDGMGRAYVTGYYTGSTIYFGTTSFSCSSCYSEAFLASIDANGNWLWAQRMYGSYYEYGEGVAVNQNGDIVVTGRYSSNINIGGNTLSNGYSYDYHGYVAGFTSTGGYRWSHSFGYASYETMPYAATIDGGGNSTICGRFQYRTTISGTQYNAYGGSSGNYDIFIAHLTSSGAWSWVKTGGGTSTDECTKIDADESTGEIAFSGYFYGNAWFGPTGLTSQGSNDALVATLDVQGNWNWILGYGSSGSDYGRGISIAGDDTYLSMVAGGSLSVDGEPISNSGSNDIVVVAHGLDSDGDKIGDRIDDFPLDPSQWTDTDGDGYGDNWADPAWNATRQGGLGSFADGATNPDACPSIPGNSTEDRFGCPDRDGDGHSDANDQMPDEPTQWSDGDGDGYGENPLGINPDACPHTWGTSTIDRYGCQDLDGDGSSDLNDAFFNKPSQWNDSDGDGRGDNWYIDSWNASRRSHWPGVWISAAWMPDESPLDRDDDGFEDPELPLAVAPYDDCPDFHGTSFRDLYGCADADGDGWSDNRDEVDDEPTQWDDADGDGYGDNQNGSRADDCPTRQGTSTIDRLGCPDSDGDGISNDGDDCPTIASPLVNGCPDADADGVVDVADSGPVDSCPNEFGTSTVDRLGCPDSDGDGVSDEGDPFPTDSTQWIDDDLDEFGDSPDGERPDACINAHGTSTEGGMLGCPDEDGDGWADVIDGNQSYPGGWSRDSRIWSDQDGDGWADQQQTEFSDDCPWVSGNSTSIKRGCPDLDGDGIPDAYDWDIDGDGYSNDDERRTVPPSDLLDASSTPIDLDNDTIPDDLEPSVFEGSAGQVQAGASLGIVAILVLGLIAAFSTHRAVSRRQRNFDRLEESLLIAEGFGGVQAIEREVKDLLKEGALDAGRAALMHSMIDDRRFSLEDDMRGAAAMDEWAGGNVSALSTGPGGDDPYAQQLVDQGYAPEVASQYAAKVRDHVMAPSTPSVPSSVSGLPELTPEQIANGWTPEMLAQWYAENG